MYLSDTKALSFALLFSLLVAQAFCGYPSWNNITPLGAPPRKSDKPNFMKIGGHKAVLFNGVLNNCTSGTTVAHTNDKVYIYNTKTNTGKYVNATGDIPSPRMFASAWHSGPSEIMIAGGVFYNADFSVIDFKPYDTIYKLTISDAEDGEDETAVWTAISSNGQAPTPRTEMSTIQNPFNEDEVYHYGGVNIGQVGTAYAFLSRKEVFKYTISTNTYELLHPGSPIDDGSDGLPVSRYHAHVFFIKKQGVEEFEIHQGVHSSTAGPIQAVELEDSWRFNVNTKQWRRIYPEPPIALERRHGANFQIRKGNRNLFCIVTGDGTHSGQTPTLGCAYPIATIDDMVCSNPEDGNGNGSWFTVNATGTLLPAKYPAGVLVKDKFYIAAGTYAVPYNANYTMQVFHDQIRVLDLSNITF